MPAQLYKPLNTDPNALVVYIRERALFCSDFACKAWPLKFIAPDSPSLADSTDAAASNLSAVFVRHPNSQAFYYEILIGHTSAADAQ
jgi:hypothetical protein